jgi:E3 ubiquitin-protein ligase UHRF1
MLCGVTVRVRDHMGACDAGPARVRHTVRVVLLPSACAMPTDWDRERAANIQRNKELLAALAVEKPAFEPKQKKRPAKAKAKAAAKRPASEATDEEDDEEPPRKAARVVEDGGPRRSGRNAGRAVDYTGESEAAARRNKVEPVSVRARRESNYGGGPEGREDGRRTQNPSVRWGTAVCVC